MNFDFCISFKPDRVYPLWVCFDPRKIEVDLETGTIKALTFQFCGGYEYHYYNTLIGWIRPISLSALWKKKALQNMALNFVSTLIVLINRSAHRDRACAGLCSMRIEASE